ncbi:MAG: hypothetical protein JNM79_04780 [Burkholderiales bacterium]|nr:hypothetical protein [Burkholderiales bacterium]
MRLFSPSTRVLAIGTEGAECHRPGARGTPREAGFGPGETDAFQKYAAAHSRSVFVVLTDLIEEDFRQDTIPFLRGAARSEVLERKTAQVYRDTPFHTVQSLGRAKDGRRDERVLLMALTNAPILNDWLAPLAAGGARVARLVTPPALAPRLVKALGGAARGAGRRAMVVTLNRAGLRQTLIEDGTTRFSRLAAIPRGEAGETAAACLAEVTRTQQYLGGLRLIPRDEPLSLILVTPPGEVASWQSNSTLPASIDASFVDLGEACRRVGAAANNGFADGLWISLAARARDGIDFAPVWLKEAYRLWQARSALWATGAGTLVAGCLVAAAQHFGALGQREDAMHFLEQATRNERDFKAVKAGLPPLPASAEHIKAGVLALEKLGSTTLTPAALMGDIARSLNAAPEFTLERADWIRGATPDDTPELVLTRGGAPAPGGEAGRYEIAVLSGTLTARTDATGARAVLASAERTVAALRAIPGSQVQVVRAPFDLSPSGSVTSGEGLAAGGTEPPLASAGFTVRVARKAAP